MAWNVHLLHRVAMLLCLVDLLQLKCAADSTGDVAQLVFQSFPLPLHTTNLLHQYPGLVLHHLLGTTSSVIFLPVRIHGAHFVDTLDATLKLGKKVIAPNQSSAEILHLR